MSQSLERGILALKFMGTRKSIGVTELAEKLEINKSTAFRILNTLQKQNMVEQDSITAKYRLGAGILQLSEQVNKNYNFIAKLKPLLENISEKVGESVHLCALTNRSAIIVDQVMTSSRLSVNAKIGMIEPLHASSVGKCMLAFGNESLIELLQLEKYTENTIIDKDNLNKELELIREKGYSLDNSELSLDIKCVAVPIFDINHKVKYSVGVSGPASRMTDKKVKEIAESLVKLSASIYSN